MTNHFGPNLRAARTAKGLSLRAVASAVGISASLLSQVETGKTQPSVSTLYALVTHLGVSVDGLMAPPADQRDAPRPADGPAPVAPVSDAIQRAEDNPSIEMENGVTWERLAVGSRSEVDPLLTTYAPGASSSVEGRLMRHAGTEYGYLMEGELTLKLDFDTHVLRAGDSLCFASSRPHLYFNHTDRPARGIWFVVGRHNTGDGGNLLARLGLPEPGTGPVRSAVDALAALRPPQDG
ncbi:helix-turn-helix domain-containing protein [Streptomyces sp. NPDC047000]|uniref:helix-turn-helix domain-containing protein n=1 Tax=Streptomyces sp. NPDC047000 TaxID=3155474 RepID=UPI00340CEABB